MKNELKRPETMVWMETPYRLHKLLEEIQKTGTKREIFLAMDLGSPSEKLLRGNITTLLKEVSSGEKREFVMVVSQIS